MNRHELFQIVIARATNPLNFCQQKPHFLHPIHFATGPIVLIHQIFDRIFDVNLVENVDVCGFLVRKWP